MDKESDWQLWTLIKDDRMIDEHWSYAAWNKINKKYLIEKMIRWLLTTKGVLVYNEIDQQIILNLNMIQWLLSSMVHALSREVDGVQWKVIEDWVQRIFL